MGCATPSIPVLIGCRRHDPISDPPNPPRAVCHVGGHRGGVRHILRRSRPGRRGPAAGRTTGDTTAGGGGAAAPAPRSTHPRPVLAFPRPAAAWEPRLLVY